MAKQFVLLLNFFVEWQRGLQVSPEVLAAASGCPYIQRVVVSSYVLSHDPEPQMTGCNSHVIHLNLHLYTVSIFVAVMQGNCAAAE